MTKLQKWKTGEWLLGIKKDEGSRKVGVAIKGQWEKSL